MALPSKNPGESSQHELFAWSVLVISTLLLLSACGTLHEAGVYKLYPGPALPDSEVATLEFGSNVFAMEINDLKVHSNDYSSIKLAPGTYKIRWDASFEVGMVFSLDLLAGHRYTANAERGFRPSDREFLWIEDITTEEVVAGNKKARKWSK
jgi:hypothetical protein